MEMDLTHIMKTDIKHQHTSFDTEEQERLVKALQTHIKKMWYT